MKNKIDHQNHFLREVQIHFKIVERRVNASPNFNNRCVMVALWLKTPFQFRFRGIKTLPNYNTSKYYPSVLSGFSANEATYFGDAVDRHIRTKYGYLINQNQPTFVEPGI